MAALLHDPIGSCHTSPSSLDSSSRPQHLDEDEGRHFPLSGRARARRTDPRYRYAWSCAKYGRLASRAVWTGLNLETLPEPRLAGPHHRAALQANGLGRRSLRSWPFYDYPEHDRRPAAPLRHEEREGRELAAAADVAIPGDGDRERGRRPPSLERQEAFWDERTLKKRARTWHAGDDEDEDREGMSGPRRTRLGWSTSAGVMQMDTCDSDKERREKEEQEEAAALAELYELGLLYDNEHERGSGFDFGAITHDQPLFTFNVQLQKRGRKRRAADAGLYGDQPLAWNPERGLSLHLSLSALQDDDAISRYLISPDESEAEDEKAQLVPFLADIRLDGEDYTGWPEAALSAAALSARPPSPPLTIIYELAHGEEDAAPVSEACPCLDADGSDTDVEVEDADNYGDMPASDFIPNWIFDLPEEGERAGSGKDVAEDYDFNDDNDWAILRDGDGDHNDNGPRKHLDDTLDMSTAAADNLLDAWVVLS